MGAAKAQDFTQLQEALQEAFKWDYKVLIEPGLNPREIECSVTGNGAAFSALVQDEDDNESLSLEVLKSELQQPELDVNKVRSYLPGEIAPTHQFYDYDAKYVTDTSTAYIPARICEDLQARIRDAAARVFKAVGCQGLSRVDFFATEDDRLVFNEINTIPGFTSISMYPKLFAASGIPYPELIDALLELALDEEA